MKRYMVFLGMEYYPSGGMNDFLTDADTVQDAIECIDAKLIEDYMPSDFFDNVQEYLDYEKARHFAHVYDTQDEQIVYRVNT